ncbi:hypothetical protein [uncultured Treponema sp.]|nr:hypothetical protein [uncultured Treponema sp.]
MLKNGDATTGKVTIANKKEFKPAVSNTGASSTAGTSDTLGTFTVADAK